MPKHVKNVASERAAASSLRFHTRSAPINRKDSRVTVNATCSYHGLVSPGAARNTTRRATPSRTTDIEQKSPG